MIRISSVIIGRVRAHGRAGRDDGRRHGPKGNSRALGQALTRIVVETVCVRLAVQDQGGDRGGARPIDDDQDGVLDDNDHTVTDQERHGSGTVDTVRTQQYTRRVDTLVLASMDALDAYLATPEARALCPVTSCLCGRNFETFVRDIVCDLIERDAPSMS
ncbi:hypothetical protein pneo_cds_629 [Pandoravirus neocaledonia]|uniref:Uncharacterized protein n=1 Tax=Pandoravirus neocaledonia TaxID=2107708 RepID=A0A2U7UCR9_9VIRU|nr:hypothetical protein pneo_cds_629 [Pandoravirus neocaledonia]AVK76236.1 hypothetical protein pneo_cds_629 [Pandoravirus neocaledonia]